MSGLPRCANSAISRQLMKLLTNYVQHSPSSGQMALYAETKNALNQLYQYAWHYCPNRYCSLIKFVSYLNRIL